MKKIEILAPAGSVESMKAAINAGCDAVYIGGTKFGARAYANNLDQDMLLSAIDYAHVRGKQLYLTVNTLLKQEELESDLYVYLRPLYEHGLDAVIVQDVGAMHFIHENFEKLPIHASTQMTLTMAQGANELKDYGVSRVVPARELSLEEIARLRKDTTLEIEAFVHGALCYCYSGQCFMSSMIGGRSGNRGRCAQPCRMEYSVTEGNKKVSDAKESYVLSPKDMCTLPMVAEMIEAGIDSFKIEGRMKRPEYAAGVTLAYKSEVDLYMELGPEKYREFHKKHPEAMEQALQNLQDLYNRGGFSTGYYLNHNGKKMMSMHRPNHSGVLVGTVKSKKGIQAEINLCSVVHAQDVLEFRHNGEQTYEFTVKNDTNKGQVLVTNTKPKSRIEIGDEVYRTKNEALLARLSKDYIMMNQPVSITGHLTAKIGQPLTLSVTAMVEHAKDGCNIRSLPKELTVTLTGEEVQAAQRQPMLADNLREKLSKTKETPFLFSNITIDMTEDVFFPIGKLNELRRMALEQLEVQIATSFYRTSSQVIKEAKLSSQALKSTGMTATVMTLEQCQAACEIDAVDEIIFDLAENSFEEVKKVSALVKGSDKKLLLRLPYILRSDSYDELLKYKEQWNDDTIDGYLVKNFEELSLLKTFASHKLLRLDYNMYVMNTEAVKFYAEQGITEFTASIELNSQELKSIPMNQFDLIVYGFLPLMVSAQCVKKNMTQCRKVNHTENSGNVPLILTDRTKMDHEVRTNCHYCYNSIYNGQCLSLLGNSKEILALQPRNIRLDFVTEDYQQTKQVLNDFYEVFYHGKSIDYDSAKYTKGHFKRGIL